MRVVIEQSTCHRGDRRSVNDAVELSHAFDVILADSGAQRQAITQRLPIGYFCRIQVSYQSTLRFRSRPPQPRRAEPR